LQIPYFDTIALASIQRDSNLQKKHTSVLPAKNLGSICSLSNKLINCLTICDADYEIAVQQLQLQMQRDHKCRKVEHKINDTQLNYKRTGKIPKHVFSTQSFPLVTKHLSMNKVISS